MIFRRTTLRLTIAYTVVQLSLFSIFSLGIYFFVTGRFDVEGGTTGGDPADPEVILLRNGLIIFFICLLFVVPLSSWLMARSALRPIKESFQRQLAFIDGASHEMRSPLSVIQGELELALARSRTGAQYREAIASALEATVDLSRLSDDLLKLSGASREELTSTFVAVDLDSVVADAVSASAVAADIARVHMSVTRGRTGAIDGRSELLVRAVANILENAVKFSRPGGAVTVETSAEGNHFEVRVHDDGVGMSSTEIEHAFERFWRADAARSTPGHGLGLALVEQIVVAHNGTVTIHSPAGTGTTITVRLPTSAS